MNVSDKQELADAGIDTSKWASSKVGCVCVCFPKPTAGQDLGADAR